jgi:CubicO group peptidase (beta-lactamase class C family)
MRPGGPKLIAYACYGQMNRFWNAKLCRIFGGSMPLAVTFLVALFSLAICPDRQAPAAPAQAPSAGQIDTKNPVPDSVLAGLVKAGQPGFALLLRHSGRTVYLRTEGLRDLRTRAKIDAATNFRLASFTKQFTAMAVMLLVHDKKLRYNQTLTEIFPEFPGYGKNITIRNLLNHTGGLPDYEDLMEGVEAKRNSWAWTPERQIQDSEVLSLLEKAPGGKFPPGSSWSYSNSGYVVLGLIVAKVSGEPYADFLRDRIFAPLHMDHTIVYLKGKNEVTNRAYGHSKEGDTLKETDQSPTSATLGDGGIYSNLEDLAKWDDALRNHTLLSGKEFAPALTPAKLVNGSPTLWPRGQASDDNLSPGKPVSYGFGWFLDPYQALPGSSSDAYPRMWHTGGTMGFRTVIERFAEGGGLTVIILCNRTDLDPKQLAEEVAKYYPPLK